MIWNKVIVAGTFDRLHDAHKVLLSTAYSNCKNELIIGITSENMILNKKYHNIIQPLEMRICNVKNFIETINKNNLILTIKVIYDKYSISTYDNSLDCIVVSDETYSNAIEINEIRKKNNLNRLAIIKIKTIDKISSTLLREQEILNDIPNMF